jgi:flavin-dependent dehydrogenase
LEVIVFERRRHAGGVHHSGCGSHWHGCNFCAGGISPRLHQVLEDLNLKLPETVVQSRIHSVTIQGFWKNIELEVPGDRQMVSVFRGSRPAWSAGGVQSFDGFLLDQALAVGATLVEGDVLGVDRPDGGKPVITCHLQGGKKEFSADFVAFAVGVNNSATEPGGESPLMRTIDRLMPGFARPRTRRTLIFEIQAGSELPGHLKDSIYFVEYGSKELPLEMCSLVPKRKCVTVVLVGKCVDAVRDLSEARGIMRRFVELPHIRRTLSPVSGLTAVCACSPYMVTGSARNPFGDRVSAVGDMATSRLYKDGILSAHQTAKAIADTLVKQGVDEASLRRGYGPTLKRFARHNRFASVVFLLHRCFFSSSVLSRVLYQAVISERKTTPSARRHLEKILWRIASGDDEYEEIFWSMVHPATLWAVLIGGGLVTLRNYLTELVFGLQWEGFGRFTTGVSLERLEEKRRQFSRLVAEADIRLPANLEFERMYTIKIAAPRELILDQLENFGETDRSYLHPRWVRIQRVEGTPHAPGCVIQYRILSRHLTFRLRLEQLVGDHLAVYRVLDGFARGGVLLFEVEDGADGVCLLSIYVAFCFPRGGSLAGRMFWRLFRLLFPAFVHDVLWNHSLCQLRDVVETRAHQPPPDGPLLTYQMKVTMQRAGAR